MATTLSLYQGATLITSWTVPVSLVLETSSYTLTAGEFASITDPSTLQLWLNANGERIFLHSLSVEAPGVLQYFPPISDANKGSWTASIGTDLYAMVGESAPSDTDYITSSASPSNDTCVMKLKPFRIPNTGGKVSLSLRARKV